MSKLSFFVIVGMFCKNVDTFSELLEILINDGSKLVGILFKLCVYAFRKRAYKIIFERPSPFWFKIP